MGRYPPLPNIVLVVVLVLDSSPVATNRSRTKDEDRFAEDEDDFRWSLSLHPLSLFVAPTIVNVECRALTPMADRAGLRGVTRKGTRGGIPAGWSAWSPRALRQGGGKTGAGDVLRHGFTQVIHCAIVLLHPHSMVWKNGGGKVPSLGQFVTGKFQVLEGFRRSVLIPHNLALSGARSPDLPFRRDEPAGDGGGGSSRGWGMRKCPCLGRGHPP